MVVVAGQCFRYEGHEWVPVDTPLPPEYREDLNPLPHNNKGTHMHGDNTTSPHSGCGWTERTLDPNLISALDKLGERFGPLGVAFAAVTRTEPEALSGLIAVAIAHQPALWEWLLSDRYQVKPSQSSDGHWMVLDTEPGTNQFPQSIAIVYSDKTVDAEDTARAMASHLNRQVVAAKVAQARLDTADETTP